MQKRLTAIRKLEFSLQPGVLQTPRIGKAVPYPEAGKVTELS